MGKRLAVKTCRRPRMRTRSIIFHTSLSLIVLYSSKGLSDAFLVAPRHLVFSTSPSGDTWRNQQSNPELTQSGLSSNKNNNDWDREIDEKSRQRAARGGSGVGETAAGAILGGLLLGPFGALFGASIGSNIGAQNAASRARKEEMERMGISQEMLDMAQEIGSALERSIEGLKACRNSLETQQRLARRLDADVTALYDRAKQAMTDGDEETARRNLMERQKLQDKLKGILLRCADEKKRLETMESNVSALETRATEVDALLRRTVGAKAVSDSSAASLSLRDSNITGLSLENDDPLLQKFKDMGID